MDAVDTLNESIYIAPWCADEDISLGPKVPYWIFDIAEHQQNIDYWKRYFQANADIYKPECCRHRHIAQAFIGEKRANLSNILPERELYRFMDQLLDGYSAVNGARKQAEEKEKCDGR